MSGRLSALYTYPVKGCAPLSLTESKLQASGLEHDRRFAVIDAGTRKVLTQRDAACLALIEPTVESNRRLSLSYKEAGSLSIAVADKVGSLPANLWGTDHPAVDQGDQAAQWLSDIIGRPCRLVQQIEPGLPSRNGDKKATFVDCAPLLVVCQASLDDLNTRLAQPVPMSRFRPSLVLTGTEPYAEDLCASLTVGDCVLTPVKPCARCVVINIDQELAVQDGPEPLRTLSDYRRSGEKVNFGFYYAPQTLGSLRSGDNVLFSRS